MLDIKGTEHGKGRGQEDIMKDMGLSLLDRGGPDAKTR